MATLARIPSKSKPLAEYNSGWMFLGIPILFGSINVVGVCVIGHDVSGVGGICRWSVVEEGKLSCGIGNEFGSSLLFST